MNPSEEAAFETSIFHYFLFKSNQASTAAAREAAQPKQKPAPAATNDETAAKGTDKAAADKDDDGNNKQPAKPSEPSDKNPAAAAPVPAASNKPPAMPTGQPPIFAAPAGPHVSIQNMMPGYAVPPGPLPLAGAMPPMMPGYAPPPPGLWPAVPPVQQFPGGQFPGGMMAPPGQQPVGVFPPQNANVPAVAPQAPPQQSPANAMPPMMPAQPPSTNAMPPMTMPASVLAKKYKKIADVIHSEFPQHASKLPPNAQWIAPDASMRYSIFPRLQQEVHSLRQAQHEQQLQSLVPKRKRGRPRKTPDANTAGVPIAEAVGPSPPKRGKYAKIANRKDVPDDVKELIANVRKESSREKSAMKSKIARLEAKVVLTKEELKKKQAAKPPLPLPPATIDNSQYKELIPLPKPKPVGPPATFESRYKELEDFKRANNHARVPGRVPGLGRWVADLRRNYRAAKESPAFLEANEAKEARLLSPADLTKERLDKLDELGFEWDVAKKTLPWQTRFEQMLEFKEKNGHCNVPRHYKPNPALGECKLHAHAELQLLFVRTVVSRCATAVVSLGVHRQREYYAKKEKVIQGERTDKLNAVGFMWRTGTRGVKVTWEGRLEQCRDFRRVHGHLKVPPPPDPSKKKKAEEKGETLPEEEEMTEEERGFRWWSFRQREYYRQFQAGKKSTLDKKRIKDLDQLGFDWGARGYYGNSTNGKPGRRDEDVYNIRIEQLTRVKELHGDCNDIRNIEKVFPVEEEHKKLLSWMKNQRKHYKAWKKGAYSSLTMERRQLLEALDFNFEPRKHYAPMGSKKRSREAAAELEQDNISDEDSTMRDYRYIHGEGSVSM